MLRESEKLEFESEEMAAKSLLKIKARRHSQFVRASRIVLPVFALGLVATYAITATPRISDPNFHKRFANLDKPTQDMRLEKPRFVGETSNGQAYEVTAGAAMQDPITTKYINLENPEAIQGKDTDQQTFVRAKAGLYSVEDKTIDLARDVELQHGIAGSEFILRTTQAKLALEDKTVQSVVGIYGESDTGSLVADKMTAYEEDGRTVFEGAVHMQIVKKPKETEEEKEEQAGDQKG